MRRRRLRPSKHQILTAARRPRNLSFRQSLGIGAAQALALIPGLSRSGASMGGGLGLRRVLRSGHGAVRGEMRLDHYFQDQNAGLEAFNAMSFKFGFDLWMR